MGRDEEGTLARIKSCRSEIIDPALRKHHGRFVKATGDGVLIEFASALDAVRCAVAIQRTMAESNASVPVDDRIEYRIGINLGDIMVDDGDIFGDDVNVAARLEALADPGGIFVTQVVHDYVRGKLLFRFVDRGERIVKNIVRPIHVFSIDLDDHGVPTSTTAHVITSVPQLSIVVLPFNNLSSDPDQEYFADSLVEDLTTDLSRIVGSFVIARNTAFTYKGRAVDATKIRQDLGVNYMLEGSVRRSGDQVRVNAQLIDTRTGGHVWADRFDGDVRDLFLLQDSITSRLAMTLSLEMVEDAARQAAGKITPDSIDLVMRGRAAALRPRDRQSTLEAIGHFERALQISPESAEAKIGLAEVLIGTALSLLSKNREADIARADFLVSEALASQPKSAWGHYVQGEILRGRRRTADAAIAYQTAVGLNRNYAPALANLGYTKLLLGEPEQALPLIQRTIEMSPRDPLLAIWHSRIGQAEIYLERYEQARASFETSIGLNRGLIWNYLYLGGVCGLLADHVRAATSLAEVRRLAPDLNSIAQYRAISQVSHPVLVALRERTLICGLRLAGFPEN